MKIRAVIVDDEPWARKRIATLLGNEPEFEVQQTCTNGDEAIEAVATLAPDVVFLDVQMAGLDGFDVIEAIGAEAMPLVVFATAHQEYALRAFDAQALDYLLKPFDEDRFRRALARVRKELQRPAQATADLQKVMQAVRPERRKFLQRVVATSAGRLVFLKTAEIDWLEASGNYVTVHAGRDTYLLRETLTAFDQKLDPGQFVRLHRSAIVNVERIRQLLPWSRGEQVAVLQDGTQITIGRAFRQRLLTLMSNVITD
jgi:two-component system, LytTR family, response regulator